MKKIDIMDGFDARSYQQSIFASSIEKNSLVVLPTGLGKTVIAIMLSVYYFNKNNKKILFLAPTRPLVEQQEKSFRSFFSNSDDFKFQVLTGSVAPSKRKTLYQDLDFIFSTPQLIENDILNGILTPEDFGFVVFDEAHRGRGNYAYCFIAKQFDSSGAKILALSASPGTSEEEIRSVMDNLRIENIEVKKYDDLDVKEYVNKTQILYEEVELTSEMLVVKKRLDSVFSKRLNMLKDMGFLKGKNINMISRKDLLDVSTHLRLLISSGETNEEVWKAISLSAGLMKLSYGIELFESQEISSSYNFFYNFFRDGGDSSKAVSDLINDIDFREAFEMILELKKKNLLHPKLHKLRDIVNREILVNKDLKIIIFNQYRDTATKINEQLSLIKEITPALFFGQSRKGEVTMSQKEQKLILNDFRENKYNVLISTSVGEEGLDIPKVDLVIFYEPVPSAIRTIQRVGRTGRFNEGKAYILQSKGTRDIATRFVASSKERKMYQVLDKIKKEYVGGLENENNKFGESNGGLNRFLNKDDTSSSSNSNGDFNGNSKDNFNNDSKNMNINLNSSKITVFVDNRENNDLLKELFDFDELHLDVRKLEIGDIVIDDYIAIERKSKQDFVNSIIDKRLFPQLLELAKNYRRPLLIIEGLENIFSIRNVNPNVIRATLSAISIDLRMPIIFTDSMNETANMILTIAKRTRKDSKEVSLARDKQAFSEYQELEKFVSSIPRINVVSAKSLLKHFGSIKNLVNSDEKTLMSCEGIGKNRAKFLIEFFEREYKNL